MIQTIGHSTHDAVEFLELLRHHRVRQVADVRTMPRSRRHPHFNREALAQFLDVHGISYRHFPELGGLRKPKPDSANTAWRETSFRGYADYMATASFATGLDALLQFASSGLTAVMCAESVWWKCHRRLLSDALVVRGVAVFHILSTADPKPHELSEFAVVRGTALTYPGLL